MCCDGGLTPGLQGVLLDHLSSHLTARIVSLFGFFTSHFVLFVYSSKLSLLPVLSQSVCPGLRVATSQSASGWGTRT